MPDHHPSEQGLSSEALRTSEVTYRRLFEAARDGILILNVDTGRITDVNPFLVELLGFSRDEMIGKTVGELSPFKDIESNQKMLRQLQQHGYVRYEDLPLETIDGRHIAVEFVSNVYQAGEHNVIQCNVRDITERKKAENKIAEQADFLDKARDAIVVRDLDGKILYWNKGATRMYGWTCDEVLGGYIVRQVLSFARGLEGERVEIQPKHQLKEIESLIRETFPKDIQLQVSVPNDVWTIFGDPTQVHQILLNLCLNGRDAMPNGGNLILTVENCVFDEQYAEVHGKVKAGRYVKMSVIDSGTGIPPNLLDKIFEPFFTTKELHRGTGLGLSTVMGIVKSHEGVMNVYSEPGKGTAFHVYLPAKDGHSESETEHPDFANLPRGNGETVLVIDDEASVVSITSETLQTFGYHVLTATDGAHGVAVYAQHVKEIALVITDMMMPVMDGPATIQALRRINPGIKIIAASGLHPDSRAAKATGALVSYFLMKPYTARSLLKTVNEILGVQAARDLTTLVPLFPVG